MVRNYLTIAIRNLSRRKGYALLNILGLAIGIACCLLIFQYVSFEKGYDDFSPKADRIVRLRLDSYHEGSLDWQSAAVYPAFGPTMDKEFPEVEDYCRLAVAELLLSNDERDVKSNENKGYYADPSFLSMFNIQVLRGDPKTALSGLDRIMLSVDMAKKYFGDSDPLGRTLVYRAPFSTKIFEVTGIFIPPSHSHLVVDYLISYPTIGSLRRQFGDMTRPEETSWGWYAFYTYLLLKPGTDITELEAKFPAFCDRYINALDRNKAGNIRSEVHSIPLKDIHLCSHYMQEAEVNGSERTVSFLFLAALFIIGIAWVNYVNLTTARSLERAREVGVRKLTGATRTGLIAQFLVEGVVINLVSLLLALVVAYSAAPWFGMLTGGELARTGFYLPGKFWLLVAVIFLVGTLASCIYPAFVLSGFRPASVLKGIFKNSPTGLLLRKGLITFQFATSVVLIAGTVIVYRQVSYMRSRPLGANIEQTLVVEGAGSVKDSSYQDAFRPFKNSVLQLPGIKSMTVSTSVMGKENYWANSVPQSDSAHPDPVTLRYLGVDYDFIPSYEMKVVAGRNFSPDFPSDSHAAILNETAVRMLGFESPQQAVGKQLGSEGGTNIIGVVRDYHTEALSKAIEPQLIILRLNARNVYSIKIGSAKVSSTIDAVQAKWNANFPNDPFNYYFLDEAFDEQYKADRQFGAAFGIFACTAIFIACMGLLGLTAYNVQQRTKEIGIRKVLGASIKNIAFLLSKDFVRPVLIAFILAVPFTWWVMHDWLQQFAYRIEIGWWIFPLSGSGAFIIALATISLQAIKAALADPVKNLRTE